MYEVSVYISYCSGGTVKVFVVVEVEGALLIEVIGGVVAVVVVVVRSSIGGVGSSARYLRT